MKRLLLALVVAGLLVGSAGASQYTFQNPTDYTDNFDCVASPGGSYCAYIGDNSGGNAYFKTHTYWAGGSNTYSSLFNKIPYATTYAAGTALTTATGVLEYRINLTDASGTSTYALNIATPSSPARIEIQMVGSQAYIYRDGILQGNSTVLSQNPYKVGFGAILNGAGNSGVLWDDIVYGDTENKYIFSMPEEAEYKISKDLIFPANNGFSWKNGTVISSFAFTTTYGKSNISAASNNVCNNESVVLENVDTGIIYETKYTGCSAAGSLAWNLTAFLASSAPYGRYYVTIPGTGAYSNQIWYLGNGATIAFDKPTYAGQDLAALTYNIDGAYWDTSTYSYSVDVISGTTGATLQSTAISASSGTATYTFTNTDPLGVYYGIVKATKLSDSSVIWMNYDYAELTSYVTIAGYVNDAETQLPISGAVVNITQNSITGTATAISDGNYSLTNYLAGTALSINATAAGYSQYYVSFAPLSAKTISLNITLNSTTPTYVGLGIGGIARDGTFSSGTITGGYGRPIQGATVVVKNTSTGESYTTTTSMTGWYLCDEGASCFLTSKRPYDVWGEKARYDNSPNYTAVTA